MIALRHALGTPPYQRTTVNPLLDLFAHVSRCEANYARLRKLLQTPATGEFQTQLVEFAKGAGDLLFDHAKISRYTSSVMIRQTTTDELTNLNLKIHIYHDTRAAEVVSYQHHTNFRVLEAKPLPPRTLRFEKIEMNRFLSELLDHCLDHGTTKQTSAKQGSSISS